MKRALAVLLTCTMLLGLTACGNGGSKSKWTDDDLIFQVGSEKVEVENDHAFIVYEDVSYLTDYEDGSYEELDEEYATSRGLELGMTIEDYKELYTVMNGYAVWELYSGDNNEWTSFDEYTNQEPSEMYDGTNNNVWLDIGFYKDGNEWKVLKDYEVQNVWFCDADLDDYEECVVFAVNFDKWGQITGISMEHFSYDDNWVEWQGWE